MDAISSGLLSSRAPLLEYRAYTFQKLKPMYNYSTYPIKSPHVPVRVPIVIGTRILE
jgi:hypothetical protein